MVNKTEMDYQNRKGVIINLQSKQRGLVRYSLSHSGRGTWNNKYIMNSSSW